MIRKPFIVLVLLGVMMLLSLACSNGDNTVVPANRAIGTIMGQVVDITSNDPIAGATVEIRSSPFVISDQDSSIFLLKATTDQFGSFRRADIPGGSVQVRVHKEGFLTSEVQDWALSPGGSGNLVFQLTPGEDPPGAFVDDDGQSSWPPTGKPKAGK